MSPAHVHKQADVQTHTHADGTKHQHVKHEMPDTGIPHAHDEADDKSAAAKCCGLFCITALASELPSLPAAPVPPPWQVPAPIRTLPPAVPTVSTALP